jgi:hypothetical protein
LLRGTTVASQLTWEVTLAMNSAMVHELEEARAAYEQSVHRLVPLLVRAVLTHVAEVLPGTKQLEVLGEINEDWIPTLRIQRVLDGDGRVLYDTETGHHDPAVEARIETANTEYLDQLLDLTGDEYLGTAVVESPASAPGVAIDGF